MGTEETKSAIEAAKRDLAPLKDELRVKLNLAAKDANKTFEEFEPRIAKLEAKLNEAGEKAAAGAGAAAEKARLEATLALNEVKAQWPGLEGAFNEVVSGMKKAGTELKSEIDMAKVKAHLAEMDAAVGGAEKREQLKKVTKEVQADLERAAGELKDQVTGFAKKLFG